jgi:glutamate racemase
MKPILKRLLPLLAVVGAACSAASEPEPVGETIARSLGVRDNPESPFYLDTESYPRPPDRRFVDLPIGVFDSGTGGLTVLEAILASDEFDNDSSEAAPGGDGLPDFGSEGFVYLGDMANMPYGNYPSVDKEAFLKELSVKDALFLLDDRYYPSDIVRPKTDKPRVKAIVIACNTSTAYGQGPIEEMIEYLGLPVGVIGVIEAGARGGLAPFGPDRDGTIGIMATVGTVSSEGYPRAVREFEKNLGLGGRIDIVQQGGLGLAGAIDGESDYIDPQTPEGAVRSEYLGPSLNQTQFPIRKELLSLYRFARDNNELLISGDYNGNPEEIQLNSVRNYVRYHVTELLVKVREHRAAPPIRTIILGCTHYPYVADEIENQLEFLRHYSEPGGETPFAEYLAEPVALVDPARLTAMDTFKHLVSKSLLRLGGGGTGEFYISRPNRKLAGVEITPEGGFTYDYKYGREAWFIAPSGLSLPPEYVLRLPMSRLSLDPPTLNRIEQQLPNSFRMMRRFNRSPRCRMLEPSQRL